MKSKTIRQFDKWSHTYDTGIWRHYFISSYKYVLANVKPYLNKQSLVLDVGCGTGNFDAMLSNTVGVKVIGIDYSQEMINYAIKNNYPCKANVFYCSDFGSFKISERFSAIFFLNCFHHVDEGLDALKKARELLKKDGLLVILDPFCDGAIRSAWTTFLKIFFKEPEAKYYREEEVHTRLTRCGFKPIVKKSFIYFTLLTIAQKD